ncbi:Retrovirus-related Pol poly from transposon opus [Paramuricea clavata]|uniref:Retrovirus-related Pol poly from transposon opus n=1 Tax=Paramuricea clavata TaxID=317549 RepID=A0A6S7IBT0_PARCT|nr:Retrovirus-related Pol poly from transposon opus [Paramuricea clavata]
MELILGQIANYCPVISRNTIVKNSTSLSIIWQAIRAHFGFQSTGGHFLDFNNIHLETDERPEDLYQRLVSFIDDNLLKASGGIRHHGQNVTADEDISPTMENIIVLTWLRLIHPSLPALVKQPYGAELRSQTVASLKPEISQALDSPLDEIKLCQRCKSPPYCFPTIPQPPSIQLSPSILLSPTALPRISKTSTQSCPFCRQAGRQHQHYLSRCPYLPVEDKQYLSRSRQVVGTEPGDPLSDCEVEDSQDSHNYRIKTTTNRVNVKQSPHLQAFYAHHPLLLTIDTGAETSMIKTSIANEIGATIQKTTQKALQADGIIQLVVVGEVHLTLSRNHLN